MKKVLKVPMLLVVILVSSALFLVGCGEKAAPADQTAKALYNLVVLQDGNDAKNLWLTDAQVTKVLDEQKKSSMDATKASFVESGLSVSDKQLEDIYNAQTVALKKLVPEITLVSEEDDVAKVKVASSYIDIAKTHMEAAEEAVKEIEKVNADKTKAVEIYTSKIIQKFQNVEPSKEKKEFTSEFKKEDIDVNGEAKEMWLPKDIDSFSTNLGKLIAGQKI